MKYRWLAAAAGACVVLMLAGCSKRGKTPSRAEAAPVGEGRLLVAGRTNRSAGQRSSPSRPQPVEAARPRWPAEDEGSMVPPKLVDGPWAKARVGQYATYRGAEGATLTRKVIKADAESVTLEVVTSLGQMKQTAQVVYPRRVPEGQEGRDVPAGATWSQEKLTVAGKELTCRVASWYQGKGARRRLYKVWLCDAVPGRLVRSAWGKDPKHLSVTLELVAFGG